MSFFRASHAWLLAAVLSIAYLIVAPPSSDLAAQQYRTDLAKHAGLTLWDNAWYGGHHMPGYSVLFPPIGAILTPQVTGALAAVAAAWLFARIAESHWGPDAALAAWWFAAASAAMLLTGRLTFALGLAFGLAAVRLAQIDGKVGRIGAPVAAVLCTLASPVAGLFLALGACAWFLADRRHRPNAAWLAAAALVPAAFLSIAFPEGGVEPFHGQSFWPAIAVLVVLFAVLPPRERLLRTGIVLYVLAIVASFVLDTPMGNNVNRLGALFAGPLLACALWPRHRALLALCALPLLYWQFLSPVADWQKARDDASVHAYYYEGLRAFLAEQPGTFRVEVPFTVSHWEARYVGLDRPLARGWQRQLDMKVNALFYEGKLTPDEYHRWLTRLGVRFVALPKGVPLDHSSAQEEALIRSRPDFLVPVWSDAHFDVYRVKDAAPLARGGAELTSMQTDGFTLRADRPGTVTEVSVHWSPYWALERGRGCVEPAPGDWTRVRLKDAGVAHVGMDFALGRIQARSPRCNP